jgi:hypothetical protein
VFRDDDFFPAETNAVRAGAAPATAAAVLGANKTASMPMPPPPLLFPLVPALSPSPPPRPSTLFSVCL